MGASRRGRRDGEPVGARRGADRHRLDRRARLHGAHLAIPSISLPLFRDEGLPLGLQVAGFPDRDADTFATAAWIERTLTP
jgi:Asp-tRNA(Asn)/Glu-tRNA(Gln) amidotransferase A subunit family amidase